MIVPTESGTWCLQLLVTVPLSDTCMHAGCLREQIRHTYPARTHPTRTHTLVCHSSVCFMRACMHTFTCRDAPAYAPDGHVSSPVGTCAFSCARVLTRAQLVAPPVSNLGPPPDAYGSQQSYPPSGHPQNYPPPYMGDGPPPNMGHAPPPHVGHDPYAPPPPMQQGPPPHMGGPPQMGQGPPQQMGHAPPPMAPAMGQAPPQMGHAPQAGQGQSCNRLVLGSRVSRNWLPAGLQRKCLLRLRSPGMHACTCLHFSRVSA